MFKKLFLALSLIFTLFSGVAIISAPAAHADTVIDKDITNGKIYDPNQTGDQQKNIEKVNKPFKLAIQVFGAIGGSLFVLAIMYYSARLFFGSGNPQKASSYWTALFSCAAGAFIFFGAAIFADMIAQLAISNN